MHYPYSLSLLTTCIVAFLGSIFLGKLFISYAPGFFRARVREYTPVAHQEKNNTPTMGGIFIIGASLIGCLAAWHSIYNPAAILALASLVGFGLIGFVDDWNKLVFLKGISARAKFVGQWAMALIVALALVFWVHTPTIVLIPLLKWQFNLGVFYVPWAMFVIVSTCNAVKLTDGLDGLASLVLLPNLILFSALALCTGSFFCSTHYQLLPAESAPLTLVAISVIGALVGFLWYNRYPARVFMGDVGSLALGAFYATLALMTKQELLIPLAGGVFVLENLSVLLQVFYYKKYKKRLFKMAPLHHHFELSGWPETKVTLLFGACSAMLSLLAAIIAYW